MEEKSKRLFKNTDFENKYKCTPNYSNTLVHCSCLITNLVENSDESYSDITNDTGDGVSKKSSFFILLPIYIDHYIDLNSIIKELCELTENLDGPINQAEINDVKKLLFDLGENKTNDDELINFNGGAKIELLILLRAINESLCFMQKTPLKFEIEELFQTLRDLNMTSPPIKDLITILKEINNKDEIESVKLKNSGENELINKNELRRHLTESLEDYEVN